MGDQPSLRTFAAAKEPRRLYSWYSQLPDEVREQISEACLEVTTAQVIEWLHTIGFEDATVGRVTPFVTEERRRRAGQAEA